MTLRRFSVLVCGVVLVLVAVRGGLANGVVEAIWPVDTRGRLT